MPRYRSTRVERLEWKHPGLRLEVNLALDRYASRQEIRGLIRSKYGEGISFGAISNYRCRRYWPEKRRVQELRNLFQAVRAELGEEAFSEAAQALIFEKLSEAMQAGTALDPEFLLKEQRLWAQLSARLEQIENQKRQLELRLAEQKKRVGTLLKDAQELCSGGAPFDAGEALKKISAVIGVGGEPEERAEEPA